MSNRGTFGNLHGDLMFRNLSLELGWSRARILLGS
jgi:hypothetical protein